MTTKVLLILVLLAVIPGKGILGQKSDYGDYNNTYVDLPNYRDYNYLKTNQTPGYGDNLEDGRTVSSSDDNVTMDEERTTNYGDNTDNSYLDGERTPSYGDSNINNNYYGYNINTERAPGYGDLDSGRIPGYEDANNNYNNYYPPRPINTGQPPFVDCPGSNQYYGCRPWYCPKTCDEFIKRGNPSYCDNNTESHCQPICRCLPGYYEDITGECISGEECNRTSECTDPNAQMVACPDPCPRTCENVMLPRPHPCRKKCLPKGCACKNPDYVLDSNGKCIPPCDCPNLSCPPGKTLNPCVPWCAVPQTCDGLFNHVECIGGDDKTCQPKCLCPEGLYDNETACVTPNECCGCNEEAVNCSTRCDATCYDSSPNVCNDLCIRQTCVCSAGYVRGPGNKCIKPEECKKYIKCSEPNEEFTPCIDMCRPTCESILTGLPNPECKVILRASVELCRGGCDCKTGFVRNNETHQCVPPMDCPIPPCQDPNAIRKPCGDPCPLTCENYGYPLQNCTEICIVNGCACKDGFVLDAKGKCIEATACPPPPCQDPNAVRKLCGDPCPLTCENFENPPQNCTEPCIYHGCACKDGFVLDAAGNCIKPIACPCTGKHEIRTACGDYCPLTCDNKNDKPRTCPDLCFPNGCTCKPGFVRNRNGGCCMANQCQRECKKKHTEWQSCGSLCPPTCANRKPICKRMCVPGCFCKKGYVLNEKKKCVRVDECHESFNNYA